jgi:hypothetical protein
MFHNTNRDADYFMLGMQTRITSVFSELHNRRLSGDF